MKILTSATKIVLLMVMVTLCYLAIRQIPIDQAFKDVVLMIVSFYFGGKTIQPVDSQSSNLG